MKGGKSSRPHRSFVQNSSPFRIPFPAPCAPRFAGFTIGNQWLLEEGGEQLASEINGMLMDFIRNAHVVPNFFGHGIR